MTWAMTSGASWSPCCLRGRRRDGRRRGQGGSSSTGSVAGPGGGAVAGRPAGVRAVAVGLRTVPPLAARRHLGPHHRGAAGPGRRGRPRDLGRFRGLGNRPGAPARRRSPEGRRRAEGAARRRGCPRAGRSRAGPVPRRPDQQIPSRRRAGTEAALGHRTAASAGTARSSSPCWRRSASPAQAGAGPAPGRTGSWPTRPTDRPPTAPGCAATGSAAPSRRRPTRSRTGRRRAAPEDGAPPRLARKVRKPRPCSGQLELVKPRRRPARPGHLPAPAGAGPST